MNRIINFQRPVLDLQATGRKIKSFMDASGSTFMRQHPCCRIKWPSFVPKLARHFATSLWRTAGNLRLAFWTESSYGKQSYCTLRAFWRDD